MKKVIATFAYLFTTLVLAQTPAEEVQNKLNSMRTMSAKFNQTITAGKRQVSQSSGTMALSRPGHFRWQTNSPLEQLVVADGNKLWVYDIDLEQVTVKKQEKGLGGTPGLFLSGYDNTVTRDFIVSASTQGANQVFDLKAKSNKENYQQVKLIYNGKTLNAIEFFDQLGQHTVVKLSNIKSNLKLADTLFQFNPPKGTDIVTQ